MNLYATLALLACVVLAAAYFFYYIHFSVDREFRSMARSATDPEYRQDELAKMDARLASRIPIADDAPAAAIRPWQASAPAVLLIIGFISVWGSMFVRENHLTWLASGLAFVFLSAVTFLLTKKAREQDKLAGLLRIRADLRRMGGDRAGAADDLQQLLRLRPENDAAWAELADDLTSLGNLTTAYGAVQKAVDLDPGYEEYRVQQVSLALQLHHLDEAREALKAWTETSAAGSDDPLIILYRAALELAAGRRDHAVQELERLDKAAADDVHDQALAGVRELIAIPREYDGDRDE